MLLSANNEVTDAQNSISAAVEEARLADRLRRTEIAVRLVELLTRRQRHVAAGSALGLSSSKISQLLGISLRTVEVHICEIHKRWNVVNRYQVARVAVYAGLDVKYRHIFDADGKLDDVLDRWTLTPTGSLRMKKVRNSAN